MRTTTVACCSVFLLLGCYSVGDKRVADESVIAQIEIGTSSKADVERLLGKPLAVDFTDASNEKWLYNYTEAGPSGANFIPVFGAFASPDFETHSLTVLFGEDGVVKNVGKGEMKN